MESNAAFRTMVLPGDNKKWQTVLVHSEPATASKSSSLLCSNPIIYIYGCGQILSLIKSLGRNFLPLFSNNIPRTEGKTSHSCY